MRNLLLAVPFLVGLVPTLGAADNEEPTFRGRTLSEWRTDLKDKDADVRRKGALSLAQMGADAKPAVEDLAGLLKDSELKVRLAATTALWQLGANAKTAAPPLTTVFKDDKEDDTVRTM